LNHRNVFARLAAPVRVGLSGTALFASSISPPRSAAETKVAAPPAHQHDFSDVARYVKAFESPARDAWQKPDDVVSLLQLWPGNVVADVGAGTGHFEPYLAKAVGSPGRVLALDVEPHMVTYLKTRVKREKLANVVVQKVAPDDPGLGEASVDRVLLVNTWHHLPARPAYAAALNRALRGGGFVVIVDFTAASPEGPPAAARLSPATVIDELEAGGLSARAIPESLPLQYVVIGQKRGPSRGRPPSTPRQRTLVEAIRARAEAARFTRGVNTSTIEALGASLGPSDEPELRALLFHEDPVVVRTAASAIAARGDAGLGLLREVSVDPALPANDRALLEEVVWAANARPKPAP